jgi:hypothetical protein
MNLTAERSHCIEYRYHFPKYYLNQRKKQQNIDLYSSTPPILAKSCYTYSQVNDKILQKIPFKITTHL